MRFNVLVKPIFPNSHFSAIFSYIGGPKVDMSYSDFLLAEKQIERFGPNPFNHFLLAVKQLERFGEMFYPIPFASHKWTLRIHCSSKQNLIE